MKIRFNPYYETNGRELNVVSLDKIDNAPDKNTNVKLAIFGVNIKYQTRGDHDEEMPSPKILNAIINEKGQIHIQPGDENFRRLIEFNHNYKMSTITLDFDIVDDGRVYAQ